MSVYLGRQDGAGLIVGADEWFPNKNRHADWKGPLDDALVSSPLIVGDKVFQGSREGWLYCLHEVVGNEAA